MMTPLSALHKSLRTIDERSKTYGDARLRIGKILAAYFPDGVNLKDEKDFESFANFFWCVAKMNRIANNVTDIHKDSALDLISYAAFMASVEAKSDT